MTTSSRPPRPSSNPPPPPRYILISPPSPSSPPSIARDAPRPNLTPPPTPNPYLTTSPARRHRMVPLPAASPTSTRTTYLLPTICQPGGPLLPLHSTPKPAPEPEPENPDAAPRRPYYLASVFASIAHLLNSVVRRPGRMVLSLYAPEAEAEIEMT